MNSSLVRRAILKKIKSKCLANDLKSILDTILKPTLFAISPLMFATPIVVGIVGEIMASGTLTDYEATALYEAQREYTDIELANMQGQVEELRLSYETAEQQLENNEITYEEYEISYQQYTDAYETYQRMLEYVNSERYVEDSLLNASAFIGTDLYSTDIQVITEEYNKNKDIAKGGWISAAPAGVLSVALLISVFAHCSETGGKKMIEDLKFYIQEFYKDKKANLNDFDCLLTDQEREMIEKLRQKEEDKYVKLSTRDNNIEKYETTNQL